MNKIRSNARAAARAGLGVAATPVVLVLVAAQSAVVGPVFKNYTVIPNFIAGAARKLLGIKVSVNNKAAAVVDDKPVWYVANHISTLDPFVLGGTLNGSFVGKGDLLKLPIVAQALRSVNFIGVRRQAAYNAESRGMIVDNFNSGNNVIMFPEATPGDGKKVHMFHAGLITALFGDKNIGKNKKEARLQKDVVVQPVAIRVKEVEGKKALNSNRVSEAFTMAHEHGLFNQLWKRLKVKNITVEVTPLPPLSPDNFSDAKDLINHAAAEVASVINPGQTVFEKAKIPKRHLWRKGKKPSTP